PSATSNSTAFLTVILLTLNSSTNSFSVGSIVPISYLPDIIRFFKVLDTSWYKIFFVRIDCTPFKFYFNKYLSLILNVILNLLYSILYKQENRFNIGSRE